jgi:hypothetical protein
MHKRKDNDVRGNMVVQWSELVDPNEAKTTGRLDVVPTDVTADNNTPLNALDLLQTHEPQHDEYYVETWEKFQKRLYYGAQKPGKVDKPKRWALKDLIVPPVNPLGLMKAAAACAKQKLQLPTLDLCAFLHATHVHPKQVAQMAKTEEVNMRLVGRHMFEAAKIILQMDSEGALPALSDPMAPYGAQVCCGCLCPKETHEARVEACRGAQVTGLHGAPYGNTSNLYSVKKDAKKKSSRRREEEKEEEDAASDDDDKEAWTCMCLEEFPTMKARSDHIALNRNGRMHSAGPDELFSIRWWARYCWQTR